MMTSFFGEELNKCLGGSWGEQKEGTDAEKWKEKEEFVWLRVCCE